MNLPNRVLVVTFRFNGDERDLERDAARFADPISNVPGLTWKLWMMNPENQSAGGVYLFESEAALNAFVDGPISVKIINQPEFKQVTMNVFGVMERPSRTTRAPLGEAQPERPGP